jgi:alginate O-acetyltransferase complex protein AlgI
MLFNYWFIILVLLALPVYYSLSRPWQNSLLIVASYAFYSYWDYRFLSLIIISTVLNFYFSSKIHVSQNPATKRTWLLISLVLNLGILGFFKYYNFFISSFISAFQPFGFMPQVSILKIILPLGISFFTFKIMGYLIDVYRDRQAPADIGSFALFVGYFPEISAGPIGRAGTFLPQIDKKRLFAKEQIFAGLQLILLGYFKKKVIADAVAPYVDQLFTGTGQFMCLDLLCGMYLYTIQIYADFSGYTDIVRGISKLFGIEIMENFRQPYLSRNIREFWTRWHISLSSWLRDYLYIPLGGSRKGPARTYANLLATMLLCGLWHGASWVFVAWGGIHGVYITVNRFFRNSVKKPDSGREEGQGVVKSAVSVFITFHVVAFAWIFFRAPDFSTAWTYISSLVDISRFGYMSSSLILITLFYLILTLAIDLPMYRSDRELLVTHETPWPWRAVVYALLILCISFLGETYVQPFIYFQF